MVFFLHKDSRYLTKSKKGLPKEDEKKLLTEFKDNFSKYKDIVEFGMIGVREQIEEFLEKDPTENEFELKIVRLGISSFEDFEILRPLICNIHIINREKSNIKKLSEQERRERNQFLQWRDHDRFLKEYCLSKREWKIFFNNLYLKEDDTGWLKGHADEKFIQKLDTCDYLNLDELDTSLFIKEECFYENEIDFYESIAEII